MQWNIRYLLALLERCAHFDVEVSAQLLECCKAARPGDVGGVEVKDDIGDVGFVGCSGGFFACLGGRIGCVLTLHHSVEEGGVSVL